MAGNKVEGGQGRHRYTIMPSRPLACLLILCTAAMAEEPRIETLADLRAARAALAAKPRRLIANNDGCDALYFPAKTEPTAENFLHRRTTALAGSQVDTVSYCTISSGFSHFTASSLKSE